MQLCAWCGFALDSNTFPCFTLPIYGEICLYLSCYLWFCLKLEQLIKEEVKINEEWRSFNYMYTCRPVEKEYEIPALREKNVKY